MSPVSELEYLVYCSNTQTTRPYRSISNPDSMCQLKSNTCDKATVPCPGYCATELNNFSGPRPASVGRESISWPVLNHFVSGHFYQDGKELPLVHPIPQW